MFKFVSSLFACIAAGIAYNLPANSITTFALGFCVAFAVIMGLHSVKDD
jgi:hypothetical protein